MDALVFNSDFIVVDMIALYSRFSRLRKPRWRASVTLYLKRIRHYHSRVDGGVRKSYYTFESPNDELIDLVYNEDELTWEKEPDDYYADHKLTVVLALILKEIDQPSRAHRIIPLRLGLITDQKSISNKVGTGLPLSYRVQPFRFQSESVLSTQVMGIISRKQKNKSLTKELHYIVKTDSGQHYHLVFDQDQSDWVFVKVVDDVWIDGG
ncbi:MAG: hypothetical protein JJU13_13255 [Balneolaceae bacterium]|nr:hypothetical protein [Balneolaceae bacterium]